MTQTEKTILTALAVIIGLALLSSMTACSPYYRDSLVSGKNYKTTKRSLRKSMSYSTWQYSSPKVKSMLTANESNMIIETSNK